MGTFPFGAPVDDLTIGLPTREVSTFVLGAYPSAVHVEWTPPDGLGRRVVALPVDNEPFPFWDGSDMDRFVELWQQQWFRPEWGTVRAAALNGSSGRSLHARWLAPLGVAVDDYFVTDCLPTSMMSTGVKKALSTVYSPLRDRLGLPAVSMTSHPSEDTIVRLATAQHDRLRAQVVASGAERIITLGNAAARVLAAVGGGTGGELTVDGYLSARRVVIDGRELEWHALVHPAVRAPWVERHDQWVATRERETAP
ncbi:hypothetical protein G7075_04610 [Phycicoccus sp. HDW14]|uniref:hypothetical protein n=1 Tax=Phycicoccus sp. HDW14 TaxID=2714941 RepID=UPI00140BAB30|nr:hypothetical protein [Phycicoccus sp. HDW14]QIM20596.1 hypothetical protein G7075_04610 [Phycicoccus sp. HDW14]